MKRKILLLCEKAARQENSLMTIQACLKLLRIHLRHEHQRSDSGGVK